jgi:DNA-binding MarR family transcriptional regulator
MELDAQMRPIHPRAGHLVTRPRVWGRPEAANASKSIGYRCRCDITWAVKQSSRGVSREDVAEGFEQAAILMVRHMSDRAARSANMALDTLNREGPARVTTLAAALGIGQPSMTELVQRLERKGLVTRVEDPGDGRAALATITHLGRALLDDQRRGRRERVAELLAALPAEDEASLTLAMHVALPIIRRLIEDAQRSPTRADGDARLNEPT